MCPVEHQSDATEQDRALACPPAAKRGLIACIVFPQVVMVMGLGLAWSQGVFRRPEGLFWIAPILPPLSALVGQVLWAWRTRRLRRRLIRARGHLCVRCAYVVDGLGSSGQCPECGLAFERTRTVNAWIDARHYRPEPRSDIEGL